MHPQCTLVSKIYSINQCRQVPVLEVVTFENAFCLLHMKQVDCADHLHVSMAYVRTVCIKYDHQSQNYRKNSTIVKYSQACPFSKVKDASMLTGQSP